MSDESDDPLKTVPDDADRIEQAWLDIRRRGAFRKGMKTAREVARRATQNPALRARALHVLGHAQSRLRRPGRAIATLLEAVALYDEIGDDRARANVYDTIGQVYATRGRLDRALYYYGLSLVDKAVLDDRAGLAVTIGNVGRLQLRAGRCEDAIRCFERDLAMSIASGDLRGQARMHEDLGRAWAGLEDDAKAETAFTACLELAEQHGFPDLVFYARIDRTALRLRQGRIEEAAGEFEGALATGLEKEAPFFATILEAARGELLLAQGAPEAIDVLEGAVSHLARADLLDVEIPVRIRLAKALMERGLRAMAEKTLLQGVRRARRAGYRRYLPALNEAMTELRLVEGALEERGRRRRTKDEEPGEPADGSYVLLEYLGEGTYGKVYRAYDPVRAREVALKLIRLERSYDLLERERLLDSVQVELEAASRVRHPGIARVYAIGREDDGGVYVVQEYVPGRSLNHVMAKEEEPDPARVMTFAARLAHALEALHEAGVVHRDLKPGNVIVRPDGTPVLVDFGIAQVALPDTPPPQAAGTLEYMAPEQARGKTVGGRADLYALGVILFEWLVGFRPLQLREREPKTWRRILEEEVPPHVREFRPDIPEEVDAMIASLLAKKPRDRPPDAATAARTFEALAGEST